MQLTVAQYVEYIQKVAEAIGKEGDYITSLDAATGDGDHWLNINIGYQKLVEKAEELATERTFQSMFMRLAKLAMSAMGGTSGALYGSAYIASAKLLGETPVMNEKMFADMLDCWVKTIMDRGNTRPGYKTMVDTLYPASRKYSDAIESGMDSLKALEVLKQASWDGANSTKEMEAIRGRASNQTGKGVGHIDPGAVTMAMQLECLAEYITSNCI